MHALTNSAFGKIGFKAKFIIGPKCKNQVHDKSESDLSLLFAREHFPIEC